MKNPNGRKSLPKNYTTFKRVLTKFTRVLNEIDINYILIALGVVIVEAIERNKILLFLLFLISIPTEINVNILNFNF